MITDICKNLNTAQQVLYIWNFVLLGVFTHPTTLITLGYWWSNSWISLVFKDNTFIWWYLDFIRDFGILSSLPLSLNLWRRNLCLLLQASVQSWCAFVRAWRCSFLKYLYYVWGVQSRGTFMTTYKWVSSAFWSEQPIPQISQLNMPKSCSTPLTLLFLCNCRNGFGFQEFLLRHLPGAFCLQYDLSLGQD